MTWGNAGGRGLLSDLYYFQGQRYPTYTKEAPPHLARAGAALSLLFPFPQTTHVEATGISRKQPPCTGGTPKNRFL